MKRNVYIYCIRIVDYKCISKRQIRYFSNCKFSGRIINYWLFISEFNIMYLELHCQYLKTAASICICKTILSPTLLRISYNTMFSSISESLESRQSRAYRCRVWIYYVLLYLFRDQLLGGTISKLTFFKTTFFLS